MEIKRKSLPKVQWDFLRMATLNNCETWNMMMYFLVHHKGCDQQDSYSHDFCFFREIWKNRKDIVRWRWINADPGWRNFQTPWSTLWTALGRLLSATLHATLLFNISELIWQTSTLSMDSQMTESLYFQISGWENYWYSVNLNLTVQNFAP
jgi:hypothetical protein